MNDGIFRDEGCMNETETISTKIDVSDIYPLICELRGRAVMFNRDLASFCHVMTILLHEAVKRNIVRFLPEFMFQLPDLEMMGDKIIPGLLKSILKAATERVFYQTAQTAKKKGGAR